MILGLITARGGSIRLPRKNAKLFCGIPLVAWSIIQSRCSHYIDLTVLTTDDDEIAEIGEKYGAKVIRRPVWDNDTTAGYAFLHALNVLKEEGIEPDEIVPFLPTSPLKKPEDIDDMIWAFHYHNEIMRSNGLPESETMITASPGREMFVFENVEHMDNAYGRPYHIIKTVADKSWKYSSLGGGWSISKADFLRKSWENQSQFDAVLDKKLFEGTGKILAYSVLPWQCFETDYEHYFHVCEELMEKFVLHGEGPKVYQLYARKYRKIVEFEGKE